MPQIEGLYVVEFGDVAIGGQTYTYWNGGVAVLETNPAGASSRRPRGSGSPG